MRSDHAGAKHAAVLSKTYRAQLVMLYPGDPEGGTWAAVIAAHLCQLAMSKKANEAIAAVQELCDRTEGKSTHVTVDWAARGVRRSSGGKISGKNSPAQKPTAKCFGVYTADRRFTASKKFSAANRRRCSLRFSPYPPLTFAVGRVGASGGQGGVGMGRQRMRDLSAGAPAALASVWVASGSGARR